jgi:hypothetical protein
MLDSMFRKLAAGLAVLGVSFVFLPASARAQDDEQTPTDSDDGNWGIPAPREDTPEASAQVAPSAPKPAPASVDPADADPRALSAFRSQLDSHGTWVNDPTYGTVWVPNRAEVGADFAPYVTAGHWALDQNGDWIWVSDYPFGNVVFHYGRWVWTDGSGWVWVPGYAYAPAWVVWRTPVAGYEYVGWAPAPPAWVWFGGVGVSLWIAPPLPYVFCPSAYVFYPRPYAYIVHDRWRAHEIARHTTRYYVPPRAGHYGPTPAAAHVPAHAVPVSRVTSRPMPSTPVRSPTSGPGVARARPGFAAPAASRQPTGLVPGRAVPAATGPVQRNGSYAGSVQAPRSNFGGYRPPSGTAPRNVTVAPRTYSSVPTHSVAPASPTFRTWSSTPSYSAPASRPSFATPATRSTFQSAPTFHAPAAAAPAPRFSAPASHGSVGGGYRSSGGGFRGGSHGHR